MQHKRLVIDRVPRVSAGGVRVRHQDRRTDEGTKDWMGLGTLWLVPSLSCRNWGLHVGPPRTFNCPVDALAFSGRSGILWILCSARAESQLTAVPAASLLFSVGSVCTEYITSNTPHRCWPRRLGCNFRVLDQERLKDWTSKLRP